MQDEQVYRMNSQIQEKAGRLPGQLLIPHNNIFNAIKQYRSGRGS